MNNSADNIILIGMPASGKSTAGVRFAKIAGYDFIDCDIVIQNRLGERLCEIIEKQGTEEFIKKEEEINGDIEANKAVIATGGSAVYGQKAMEHFKSIGTIVYMKVGLSMLQMRTKGTDLLKRGVVMRGNCATIEALYNERVPLYEKYADVTIDCTELSVEETVDALMAVTKIEKFSPEPTDK